MLILVLGNHILPIKDLSSLKTNFMKVQTGRQVYVAFAALLVTFAIVLQFNLSLKDFDGAFMPTLALFISFFTITTNLIVAVCFITLWVFKKTSAGEFFSKPSTLTAITVYIVVVGIIYNVLLRGLATPVGLARVADELLHVVNPIIFLVFWIIFVDKSKLVYKDALVWLIYPFLYVILIVIRGAILHQYPYPFINVSEMGYPKATFNAALIMLFFWLLSLLLIFVGKRFSR